MVEAMAKNAGYMVEIFLTSRDKATSFAKHGI